MSKTGTFVVVAADEASAVVRDAASGQVHALASNPGVEEGDVVEATLEPEPPMEVRWTVVDLGAVRAVSVERTAAAPSDRAVAAAGDLATGEVTELDAGGGTTDVIAVRKGTEDDACADVVADETTLSRAARLGADSVEVRSAPGVVTVRYR